MTKATATTKKNPTSKKDNKTDNTDLLKDQFAEDPQVDFSLAWSEIEPVWKKIVSNAARNLKKEGFRPGKVPSSVAEEEIDRNYLIQEVARELAPAAFGQAVKDKKLTAIAEPEIVIKTADKGKAWALTAILPQRSEIKLPAYKTFLTKKKQEILKQLKSEQTARLITAKDEEKPAELTDEQLKAQATDQALTALLAEIKPKVSRILVERAARREFEQLLEQLKTYQLSFDDYLKNSGRDLDAVSQELMFHSLQNLQMEFMLDALLDAEKITATDSEIEAKMTEVMPNVKTDAEKKQQLDEPSVRNYLALMTKRKKLADWLLAL